jgi:uncharacterized protein (DUF983 family)
MAPAERLRPGLPTMIGRGMLRRCPLCAGRGAWFRQWARKDDRCHTCGFAWNRNTDGFMTGSMTINIIVTFFLIFATLIVATIVTYPDLPVAPLVIALVAVAVVVPLVIHPMTYTIWLAVDLAMRPPTPAELADADAHAPSGARRRRFGRPPPVR